MKILKLLRWTTTWIAIWTMLISPVAAGRLAGKVSKQQLQTAINQMGLNKQMTLGQFYQKNENLYPERIKKQIKPFFEKFKNQPMPVYEITSSKTTTGEEIPGIRVTQGSQLINVQWYGEPNRMLKFQNTNITEIDLINFDDMIERILASDAKLRKDIDPKAFAKTTQTSVKKQSSKYPDITKAEWKSMSAYDRANYVINLRLLLQDARQVLKNIPEKKKPSKTSQNFFEKNRYFIALFFGEDAFAQSEVKITDMNHLSDKTCIFSGYVTEYETLSNGNLRCSPKMIDFRYGNSTDSLYAKAKATCTQKNPESIPCNPYIYGTPNGEPNCVNSKYDDKNTQTLTHWSGNCDASSRLSNAKDGEINILKNSNLKDKTRFNNSNFLLSESDRKKKFKTDQEKENYKLTEEYVLGLLKYHGKADKNIKTLSELEMNDDILKTINADKKAFDREITRAVESCKTSTAETHEPNYFGACDQLHRRFLFVDELFASKCAKGSSFNSATLKCSCEISAGDEPTSTGTKGSSKSSIEIVPGAKCNKLVAQEVTENERLAEDPLIEKATAPVVTAPIEDKKASVKVLDGNEEATADDKGQGSSVDDLASFESDGGDFDNKCGFGCKSWKYTKTAAPYLVTGALIAGAVVFMSPKKPKLHFAGDQCPNGKQPPCAQICTYPLKLQSSGLCSCDGCPPAQTADQVTCFCATVSSGAVGGVDIFTCPDSITQVKDLATCPDYPCWNGSTYKNPMNCPTQQPTVPANKVTN